MPNRVPTYKPPGTSYDRTGRDLEAKSFYHSIRWLRLRRLKLRLVPYCERCHADDRIVAATVVHHRIDRRDDRSREMDLDNLESLCPSCHSRHHRSKHGDLDATSTIQK